MKTMVISCLEPQHLKVCIKALKLWIDAEDIYIINNAFEEAKQIDINRYAEEFKVNTIRPEYVEGEPSTKKFIHRITNDFAKMFPDEIILKLDEDVILVSEKSVPSFDRGVFYIPLATINNYTTKIFAKEFWRELYDKCKEHTWMWHKEQPCNVKKESFYAVYRSDPTQLIEFTRMNDMFENITSVNYEGKYLMDTRGISTHTVFFHAQDHIDNCGDENENQEIRFFDLVKKGKFRYVIDYGMFCHHINYHTIRESRQKEAELVNAFHDKIFEVFQEVTFPIFHKESSHTNKVCVGTGWYSDNEGGKRGESELAEKLFTPSYLSEIFVPRIQRSLNPRAIHIYASECETPLNPIPEGCEVVKGKRIAKRNTTIGEKPYKIGAAHDWGAAMMTGAMFAFVNNLNYFFVEQDCLVHNFKRVYEISKEMGAPIIYGFGGLSSFITGWAEPSLTFVNYKFLQEFMNRLCKGLWHEWNMGFERFANPERQFHNTFADVAEYWPFGYGMKRPIDWSKEVFFAQRFDTLNFETFISKSEG